MQQYVVCAEVHTGVREEDFQFLEELYQRLFEWVLKNPPKSSPSASGITGIEVREFEANKNLNLSYSMNMMKEMKGSKGDCIDKWVSRKPLINELVSTLYEIQARGIDHDLKKQLKSIIMKNKPCGFLRNSFMNQGIFHVDQINFLDNSSKEIDSIAFVPLAPRDNGWSILGALVLKKNRFNQAASKMSEIGKQNVRVLRNWARSKKWEKMTDSPEIWGMNATSGPWFLKIKPEPSSRDGKLQDGSDVPRFDARMGHGEYINPFTGEKGDKKVGRHIPLEKEYY